MANILEILLKATGGDQAKNQIDLVSGAASSADQVFRKLGELLSVGALMKGIQMSIKEFENQERATIKLTSALKGQKITSEEVAKSFLKQATDLSTLTEYTDDAITSGQALALNIGVSAETIQKITPLVLDFAAATGTELNSAFSILGKASMGMTEQLRRYGIFIDEDKLKTEGFQAVVDKLGATYGGTAQAIKEGVLGPSIQFKQNLGDLGEEIGAVTLPALNKLAGALNEVFKNFGGSEQNKGITEYLSLQEKAIERLKEGNLTLEQRKDLMAIINKEERVLETNIANELTKTEKKKTEIKVENSKEMAAKLKEIREKEQKAEDERVDKNKETIKGEYDLRRELGQLDLTDVIANIEKEISATADGTEKRMALEEALSEYKDALGIEDATKVKGIQDSITSNLTSNITDMLLAEKTFAEGTSDLWDNLKTVIINAIVKTVVEEKAAAIARIAAEQAVAAAKSIAAYSGIPFVGLILGIAAAAAIISEINKRSTFQSGTGEGVVPGAEGTPVQATVHGGEQIITPQQRRRGAGSGVSIGTIEIIFPNVTTFSDWMNASPATIKLVTEKKILQALSTLEDEGKIKKGTVLI